MKILKKLLVLVAICCSLATGAYADKPNSDPGMKFLGDYVEGIVVKEPWQSDLMRIQIDKVTYIIMRDTPYYRRTLNSSGAYEEKAITVSDIHEGDSVEVKAHGNRIIQVVVIGQGE